VSVPKRTRSIFAYAPDSLIYNQNKDGCCEGDCRQKYLWVSIVSGDDPSPVFQAAEHDLDPVPSFVALFVVFDGLVARLSSQDAGRYSPIYKGLTEKICVINSAHQ
jgi:hypothetical protein